MICGMAEMEAELTQFMGNDIPLRLQDAARIASSG
jgi:hypothetical protein